MTDEQLHTYCAEDLALEDVGRVFTDIREVRHYLADLYGSEWFRQTWPRHAVVAPTVERRRLRHLDGAAVITRNHLVLSTLTEPVVLHEVAHLLTPGTGHGGLFRLALLGLVREKMGFVAWADLRHAYDGRLHHR